MIHSGSRRLVAIVPMLPEVDPTPAARLACCLRSSGLGAVHRDESSAGLSTRMCEGWNEAW